MTTLAPLLREFRATLRDRGVTGIAPTGVPGVTFFWIGESVPRRPLLYSAGIIVVGQGYKVGYLADRSFRYDAESCLVLGVPVPFECEAHGTPEEPLLGIRIDIDLASLHGLVAKFGGRLGCEERNPAAAHLGVEPVRMEGALLAATRRLLESLRDPIDRQFVGPAAVEEILYRVLRCEQGRVLHALTRHHTPYANVARALERMHRDYPEALTVDELARESAMGVSSFHRAFKQTTGESPLQYLKKLRLLKAKGLLVLEGKRVDEAAYQVGYASPSQFSREFKRYFQVPPSAAETLPYNEAV
jgi:AraC-like DNA-binding protein